MHFPRHHLSLLVPVLYSVLVSGLPTSMPVCNPQASGNSLQTAQQAAIDDFAHLILEKKDAQAAFDKYIPGTYVQHSAGIAQPGRQPTIDFLVPLYSAPGVSVSHLRTFVSKGTGILHYRLDLRGGLERGGSSLAVVDLFMFQGTCVVEHWDVLQQIMGNEVNPNAFF